MCGLRSFSIKAIYATAVVSNCNIKTAVQYFFFELKKIEIHTI